MTESDQNFYKELIWDKKLNVWIFFEKENDPCDD